MGDRLVTLGLTLTGPLVFPRVDLATDLVFATPAMGTMFQRTFAAMEVPKCKRRLFGTTARAETVEIMSGRMVAASIYDKGVQTQGAVAGRWIRLERRMRKTGRERPTLEDLASMDWGVECLGPLLRFAVVGGVVRLSGLDESRECVLAAERDGVITARVANSLLAELDRVFLGYTDGWSAGKWRGYRAKLAAIHLVPDAAGVGSQVVPLGGVLDGISCAWRRASS